ncbi:MAG: site-specific integrase [Pseudomonadota bacterium]
MTFAEAAKRVHTERLPGWKSSKAARQWLLVLEKHAFPKLGDKPISEVSSAHILEAVQPIWLEKQETARRVKQRIGIILDWGHAHNHRAEPAPMRAVDAALKKQKRSAKKHFAAMPYRELPEFLHRLDRLEGMGALGLRFLILTAARSGEVRGATWNEIDEAARTWTIPSDRMKAGDEHVVPLSDAAISILDAVKLLRRDVQQSLLFPGQRIKPMSDMTLAKALKSAGGVGYTVHGMRSSFRDWAAECTDAPHEVAEAALAHKTSDAVVRAYRRTDFFEKRRDLMIAWAHYLGRM